MSPSSLSVMLGSFYAHACLPPPISLVRYMSAPLDLQIADEHWLVRNVDCQGEVSGLAFKHNSQGSVSLE